MANQSLPPRVGLGALLLGVLGCGSSPPATMTTTGQCPDAPPSCPAPAPAYADVSALIARDCVPCHGANTGGKDESSYASITGQSEALFVQVGNCLMPPQGSPQLTTDERTLLLSWLVCGAPP